MFEKMIGIVYMTCKLKDRSIDQRISAIFVTGQL